MAKIGLDKDSIVRFFSLHVEKIVLGIVVVLLVIFVQRGYSLVGLASDERPDVLLAKAAEVKTYIDTVSPQIVTDNHPATGFVERTKAGQVAIGGGYMLTGPTTLTGPIVTQTGLPRKDPELFAAMEVEAKPILNVGISYMPVSREVDPLADDELMKPKKAAEVKKKKRRSRRNNDLSGEGGFGGEGGGGFPGGRGGFGGLSGLGGFDEGEGGEGEENGEGTSGFGGMGGMGGFGDGGAGTVSIASPNAVDGFRPPPGAIVVTRHIVGVTARINYKKQWDEYVDTFANAMDYNRVRDRPTYLGFYAERTEVKDEFDTDYNWKVISNSDYVIKQMNDPRRRRPFGGWAGYPREIADPRYVLPGILTMPIPPIVSRSYDEIAIHSKIPRYQIAMQEQATSEGDDLEAVEDSGEPMDIGSAPSLTGGAGSQNGFGEGGAGMEGFGGQGMGRPGMGGSGMQGMGPPGMGGGGMQGMGPPGMAGGGTGMQGMGRPGMGGFEGDGEEGGEGYGSFGGMGMGGGTPTFGPSVDYLMVRFFDLSIKDTTKKYRYRIQLWVEDPNHPKNQLAEPNLRALEPRLVRSRIADIKAKETEAKRRLSFFRRTEFSEPSSLVSFDVAHQTLGGELSKNKPKVIDDTFGNQFDFLTDEQTAKVMSVVWDKKRAIDVPGVLDARRGTFLNFDMDADVVHPVTLQYKTIEGYAFRTQRMVMDFMGGQPLPVPEDEEEDNPLFGPAEFLFLNEKGEFFVKNELDDWDGFQKRLPPVPAAVETMFGGGGEGVEGMEGMGDGMEGRFGGGKED
jgi:hypothetical protein